MTEQSGRAYIAYNAKGVTLALQDDERTLKVFIEGRRNEQGNRND